jgi:hypothetical protein
MCELEDTSINTDDTDQTTFDTADSDTASDGGLCESNQDCGGGEVCLAWKDTDSQFQGPKICRNTCFSSDECDAFQICELSLSDGRPMDEHRLTLACLDEGGFEGCDPSSCRECAFSLEGGQSDVPNDLSVQPTICNENLDTVLGCFVAWDSACGLLCDTRELSQCDESCSVTDGVAACETVRNNPSDGWCADYSCNTCETDIGGSSCLESQKQACMSIALTEAMCGGSTCACDEICVWNPVGECE